MQITYTYDKEDIKNLANSLWKRTTAIKNLMGWAFLGGSLAGGVLIMSYSGMIPLFLMGPVVGVILILVAIKVFKNALITNLENQTWIKEEQKLDLNEEGINRLRQDSECFYDWKRIRSLKREKDLILIFIDGFRAITIPQKAFTDPEKEAGFLAFAESKIAENKITK